MAAGNLAIGALRFVFQKHWAELGKKQCDQEADGNGDQHRDDRCTSVP
jgi:hypothetical protein